jgi:hypothetical protein
MKMVYRDVGEWLRQRYGMTRGYPFGTVAAEQEKLLSEFFVSVEGYERLQDLKNRILFAPEGYGKSAVRVMFAAYLAANTQVLGVEYTCFDRFPKQSKPTGQQQITHLLHLAVKQVVAYVLGGAPAGAGLRLRGLSASHRATLGAFIHAYAAELYSPHRLYPIFQGISARIGLSWGDFEACVNAKRLGAVVDVNEQLAANPIARFWADVVAHRSTAGEIHGSPLEMLKTFAAFTKAIGLTGLYFLVDGLTESRSSGGTPVAPVDFLESLFATEGLFDIEGVRFGFFLTTHVWHELKRRACFQQNQIEAVALTRGWSDQKLRDLLRLRLLVYSDGNLPDFSLLCHAQSGYGQASATAEIQRLSDFMESQIVAKADGSPRRLLRLLNALLFAHLQRYPDEPFVVEQGLDERDWQLIQPYMESILGIQNQRL